jgi:hypothetical protein
MSTITVNLGVQVSGGPPISIPPHKIEGVESFQQVELLLKRDAEKDVAVTKSVSLGANPVFLSISSDWIDLKEAETQGWFLTCKIGETEILLNSPQIYLRSGILSLAKDWVQKPQKLDVAFKKPENSTIPAADLKEAVAKVNIFIGYDLDVPKEQTPTL